MKKLFFLLLCFSFVQVFSQTKSITITNPLDIERKDEMVVLKREFIENKLGNIPAGKFIQIYKNNIPKVLQFDDLNNDGKWDEIVFLQDFSPKEKIVFNVQKSNNPSTVKAVVRAYVRHKHKLSDDSFGENILTDTMPFNNLPTDFSKQKLPPFLTEGPAWENDKVGFRKYFDLRNSNDIWGKTTDKMVLDFVGVDPSKSYHHIDSWGMDILKVGKSLGAGAFAINTIINGKDTLIRPGKNATIIYKQLSNGPVRAMFDIIYKDWKYLPNAMPITITERISIWGGQYFFQNEIFIDGNNANLGIATGIIDFYSDQTNNIFSKNYTALFTHGKQSENNDLLGLGIIIPANQFQNFGYAMNADINNVFTVNLSPPQNQKYIYRYYAAWEKSNSIFKEQKNFEKFIREEGEKFSNKIILE